VLIEADVLIESGSVHGTGKASPTATRRGPVELDKESKDLGTLGDTEAELSRKVGLGEG
jgi:hypothetical protein